MENSRLQIHCGILHDLPYPDRYFDVVCGMNSIRKFLLVIALIFATQAKAQDALLEIKHYRFYSSALLNQHLFLCKHAIETRNAKLPEDSLSFYLVKAGIPGNKANYAALVEVLKFYRDSVAPKDMLFDSTMRKFSTLLALNKLSTASGWQLQALKHFKTIEPWYKKQIWPSIDSANKAWIKGVKADLTTHEEKIVSRLQKIYGQQMPKEKIRVDLGVYATWAGAYSYTEGNEHIVVGSFENANQGKLGVEIVFHEGSHFLIDSIYNFVADYSKAKNLRINRGQTWHIVLFYTTGNVVKEIYAAQHMDFEPYYKHAKFEENIPPFKLTTTALGLHWDPYMRGEGSMQESMTKVMDYIVANLK